MTMTLRAWLSEGGSYSRIAHAATSGRLPELPVALSEHIGDVYRRVETAAGPDAVGIEALRFAALVHEEPPESLPALFRSVGLADVAEIVAAVTNAFGRVWKLRAEDEFREYVEAHKPYLAQILLFEVSHEGRSIPEMERAAEIGGLQAALESWVRRLDEEGHR
jgi:hypothetical protein